LALLERMILRFLIDINASFVGNYEFRNEECVSK